MDYSLPGSSVHRIFQARILEWAATPSARGPSWGAERASPESLILVGGFFTTGATWEAHLRPVTWVNLGERIVWHCRQWRDFVSYLTDLQVKGNWARGNKWLVQSHQGHKAWPGLVCWSPGHIPQFFTFCILFPPKLLVLARERISLNLFLK